MGCSAGIEAWTTLVLLGFINGTSWIATSELLTVTPPFTAMALRMTIASVFSALLLGLQVLWEKIKKKIKGRGKNISNAEIGYVHIPTRHKWRRHLVDIVLSSLLQHVIPLPIFLYCMTVGMNSAVSSILSSSGVLLSQIVRAFILMLRTFSYKIGIRKSNELLPQTHQKYHILYHVSPLLANVRAGDVSPPPPSDLTLSTASHDPLSHSLLADTLPSDSLFTSVVSHRREDSVDAAYTANNATNANSAKECIGSGAKEYIGSGAKEYIGSGAKEGKETEESTGTSPMVHRVVQSDLLGRKLTEGMCESAKLESSQGENGINLMKWIVLAGGGIGILMAASDSIGNISQALNLTVALFLMGTLFRSLGSQYANVRILEEGRRQWRDGEFALGQSLAATIVLWSLSFIFEFMMASNVSKDVSYLSHYFFYPFLMLSDPSLASRRGELSQFLTKNTNCVRANVFTRVFPVSPSFFASNEKFVKNDFSGVSCELLWNSHQIRVSLAFLFIGAVSSSLHDFLLSRLIKSPNASKIYFLSLLTPLFSGVTGILLCERSQKCSHNHIFMQITGLSILLFALVALHLFGEGSHLSRQKYSHLKNSPFYHLHQNLQHHILPNSHSRFVRHPHSLSTSSSEFFQ